MLVDFLKQHPPLESALLQVLFVCGLAAWLCWRGASRLLKGALLAVAAGYWILATPLGAGTLIAGLSRGLAPIQSPDEARGADTIVLLGSGADTYSFSGAVVGAVTSGSAFRALEAARVYRLIGARAVIASGGTPGEGPQFRLPESRLLKDALMQAGVPSSAIVEESTSTTTREEGRLLAPILTARGARRFVLVTSPMHMRRSLAVFRREGLDPIPSIAPLQSDASGDAPLLLPNDHSRYLSDLALYDYGAGVYYWWLNRSDTVGPAR